jgi:PAS domain S-box-containing protein
MEDLAKKYAYLRNRTIGVRVVTYIQLALVLVIVAFMFFDVDVYVHPGLVSIIKIFTSALLLMTGIITIIRGYAKKEPEYYISGGLFILTSIAIGMLSLMLNEYFNNSIIDLPFDSPPLMDSFIPAFMVLLAIICIIVVDIVESKKEILLKLSRSLIVTSLLAIIYVVTYFGFKYLFEITGLDFSTNEIVAITLIFHTLASLITVLNAKRWRYDTYYHQTVMTLILILFQGIFYFIAKGELHDLRTFIAEISFLIGIFFASLGHFLGIYELLNKGEIQRDLAIRQSHRLEMFNKATDNASDIIVISDPEGIILYANPAVTKMTGYSFSEVMGTKAGTLWGRQMSDSYYKNMWKTIKEDKKQFSSEIRNIRKDGTPFYSELHISPVLDRDDNIMYFVGIERDITDKRIAEKQKYDFLSVISHRLRNPLTTSRWSLEMLAAGDAGPITEEQKNIYGDLDVANQRLIDLIDIMTKVTDLESGHVIIDIKKVVIGECLDEVSAKYKELIDAKKMKVKFEVPEKLPTIQHDQEIVKTTIDSIVNNALKFSSEDSEVLIDAEYKDGYVIVGVKDSGHGIPEAEQENVFKNFYRGSNITDEDVQGTGMGLYLTKLMMDLIGGKVWFDSKESEGSTFWLAFPMVSKEQLTAGLNDIGNEEIANK